MAGRGRRKKMKQITSGQVRRFLELTEEGNVDRDEFQQRLDNPAELISYLKTGKLESQRLVKFITIKEAQILGFLVIGPKEVNKIFATSLTLKDCPIGFSKQEVRDFVARAKEDFQTDKPPVALILVTDKDGKGNSLDLIQLKKKFGEKVYSDWFVNKSNADFARQPVRQMWVLTYVKTNSAYINKNWQSQQELAKERGEQILNAAEEAHCQLMVEAITGQRGKSSTWDRTASAFDGSPVSVGPFSESGLFVRYYYFPESRHPDIGLAAAVISI